MTKIIKLYLHKKKDIDLKKVMEWAGRTKCHAVIYEGYENWVLEIIDEYDWLPTSELTERFIPDLKEIIGQRKIPFTIQADIEVREV